MAGICLFVVEDEQDLAWVLAQSLSRAGYSVVTACNGLKALQQMRRQTPALVIMDITMPVMDGFALAQRMQDDPWLMPVPILYLTVHPDFPYVSRAYGLGADDYMTKPFDLLELHARVQAILHRCKTKDRLRRDLLQVDDCTLNLSTCMLDVDGRRVQLTAIERDLMRYLMLRTGAPVSAQQLLEKVLDYPPGVGDLSTVRWHVRYLRQKMERDPSHPVHLHTLPRRGYCFSRQT